jgi:hypothetical protein
MFEVVLKQDYEDFYFFRDFEVNGVVNNNSQQTFNNVGSVVLSNAGGGKAESRERRSR